MPAVDLEPRDAGGRALLRALAEEAARAGGDVARRFFRAEVEVRLKADRSEVSVADETAQATIIACLRARRPQDAFIAEERLDAFPGLPAPSGDRVCWVIDPIDGTRNFLRHIPMFTTCVAAMYGGQPVAGAIYDPLRDILYSGALGEPLRINGVTQDVSDRLGRPRSLHPKPVVAIPSTPSGALAPLVHAWLDRYVCRGLGSTALHMAMVATGELDGMLADNPRLWDIAAGWILVTSSGGRVTAPYGEPLFPLDVAGYHGTQLPLVARACDGRDVTL
jgi:myo-inositol-1(or 4)-monophosphatase